LKKVEAEKSLKHLHAWKIVDDTIEKNYKFNNFREAVEFINEVAEVAEKQNHHPDILLWNWNNVKLTLTTHAVRGLSKDDFVLAAKIDKLKSG